LGGGSLEDLRKAVQDRKKWRTLVEEKLGIENAQM
jgi:hypothetical protein